MSPRWWFTIELLLLAAFIVVLFSLHACVIVQSVPDRPAPDPRVVIEQRQAQPVPPPPRGGS